MLVGAVMLSGFALGLLGFMRAIENARHETSVGSPDTAVFTGKIQTYVVENIGQPIEGFNADIYLRAFPGLLGADFDGVETGEGAYVYADGNLEFVRTRSDIITSAEEAISQEGHQTFFENVRGRLGIGLSADEVMNRIIAEGLGKISGTILLGPTCPVMKDPPDQKCADKPIFGEFIVKDIAGVNEIARFSTQQDGSFFVSLPAGEYSIESETPLGLGIQTYRIEVRAGEKSEYTITFDTGIR